MKSILFAFMSFIPVVLFGQNTITGIVIDSLTQEPLPSATVYVNGTTQGTTTDNDGRFELNNVTFPATVVFSFVGYQTYALDIDRNPGLLTINLKTNDELPEIVISGKNKRVKRKDLDFFKTMFLGDDRWGRRATIMNENALMIDNSYDTAYYNRQVVKNTYATQFLSTKREVKQEVYVDVVEVKRHIINAWASEPLVIDLPLLGYVLYVDLVKFTVEEVNSITSYNMLGYFYYKPYDNIRKRRAANIEENRKKAYYGSSQHFLRSFAENSLAENGFILTMPDKVVKGRKEISSYIPVDVKKYSANAGDSLVQIIGLKDKQLKIRYYHGSHGTPTNFKEKEPGIQYYSESGMTLLKDTCAFLKEGVVIDNNIRFTGNFSRKRVASSLPGDYNPPVDERKINVRDSVDYASELMKFADNIHQFNRMFPQEKVYLEFDNTAYFQGENIWFKAFVTNASTLERTRSGVLYVDFLAPTGQLIRQQKLKIEAGQTDGVIPLLDAGTFQTREKRGIMAYPSGFYEIRAYTQNMLDFSSDALFSRVIPVYTQPKYVGEYNKSHVSTEQSSTFIEDLRGESKRQKEQRDNFDVTFFPEGGDLVRGLPCRVAFKATGRDAFGVEGALVVSSLWDSIYTVHDGMGSFIITPNGTETARFVAQGLNNSRIVLKLPEAVNSGYSMMADMLSDSHMQVNIWRTPDRVGEQTALAVTCRGDVIYFEEIKDIENSQLEIDCSGWPVGVYRLTLYNKSGKILSSRSIFHNSDALHSPTITVNTDSMSRKQFDKQVIEFKLTDGLGNPLRDRFCLSVRDATDYGNGRSDNLKSNLLLSSDLRGYIHDPAWYFEANDEVHREALNLLTLVQGWERYEWQTMTGMTGFEEKHRVEEDLTMNGWILSFNTREPVSDIGVYASITPEDDKKLFESFDYQTDSTGYFAFDLSDFYGRGTFTINLMSTKKNGDSRYEKSKRIRFERADRPVPRPYDKQETDLSRNTPQVDDYKVDFSNDGLTAEQLKKLGIILDDVDIEEEGEKIRFVDYDTFTSFEAEEDAEFELDQGEYTTDVAGYLMGRGINIMGNAYEGSLDPSKSDNDNGGNMEQLINKVSNNIFESNNTSGNADDSKSNGESGSYHMRENVPYYIYAHNLTKYLGGGGNIDMIDVKSIIIYDNPMYPKDFKDLIPLEVDYHRSHGDVDWFTWVYYCFDRFYLIDIQIKEDRQLLFDWEIQNLGRRSTTVKGFARPVQFYSPQYPDGPIPGEIDPRRTLYWNPNVITDEEGHARVEFYNNSFTRKFTINAAGITASGIPYILNQNW